MRMVVLSDSHNARKNLFEIVELHLDDADLFIFLGDGERDFDEILLSYPDIRYERVSGNCDWASEYPPTKIINFNGKKVFFTHGHPYYVKHGYEMIKEHAKNIGADICLFGHTHIQYSEYCDGFSIMNPGSVRNGKYGMIDVLPSGVMLIECSL